MKGLTRFAALFALALTFGVFAAQQAQAQFDNPATDVSVRVGANVVNRATMRTVGDVWLAVGADVKLRGGSPIGEGELLLGGGNAPSRLEGGWLGDGSAGYADRGEGGPQFCASLRWTEWMRFQNGKHAETF